MLTAAVVTPNPRAPAVVDVEGTLDGRHISVVIKPDQITIAADCNATDDVLLLELSPQTIVTEGHVKDAITIDITLGDDAFDKAFHLEAAPTETVRAMFDERTRKFLLAHPRCHLTLSDRELQFQTKFLSEAELEAAIPELAHAAAQAEHAVKATAAGEARPTDRDGYRDTLAAPTPDGPYASLVRTKPLSLAARQLRHVRELRSRGHFFGSTMLATASAYVAAILAYGVPLFALIFTPVVMVFVGIGVYFVLCVLTEATGLATYYRRRRVKNLDTPG